MSFTELNPDHDHPPDRLDILFYPENSLQLPYLEPIHDYLQSTFPELKLGFSSPPYSPPPYASSIASEPGTGLRDREIARLRKKTLFCPESSVLEASIAIVSDACHYRIPHIPRVVNVGHSLTSKGLYYCNNPIVRRENLSDMICVPGPWHKRLLEESVFVPIKVTGFIRSDLLFGKQAVSRERFCRTMKVNPRKKIVLFAPTFNDELSAIPVVQDRIADLADQETVVMIKLHRMTPLRWRDMYKRLARENENVIFLRSVNYSGMMHAADVMISDVSSMFVEFMLLNKPVVLLQNPRMSEYAHFDENSIEYQIRDAVQVVDTLPGLVREVQNALESPDELKSLRERHIDELDFGRDGQSARRAGDAVYALHQRDASTTLIFQRPPLPVFVVIDDKTDSKMLLMSLNDAEEKAIDDRLNIFCINDLISSEKACQEIVTLLAPNKRQVLSFREALHLAEGDLAVILKPGWTLPHNWPKWLYNHFCWNQQAVLFKATSDPGLAKSAFENLQTSSGLPFLCRVFAQTLLTLCIGKASENDLVPSPCAMVRLPILQTWARHASLCNGEDVIAGLEKMFTDTGLVSCSALDIFVYPNAQEFMLWDQETLMRAVDYLKQRGRLEEAVKLLHDGFSGCL